MSSTLTKGIPKSSTVYIFYKVKISITNLLFRKSPKMKLYLPKDSRIRLQNPNTTLCLFGFQLQILTEINSDAQTHGYGKLFHAISVTF